MSLTAAASGFVVFLLSVQVIQGQNGWGVTYTSTQICALKGSTVEISCRYRYPSTINRYYTTVETFWVTEMNGNEHVDLRTESEYAGRVQYSCNEKSCTLRITDLRESDSAEYKFRFITNQPGGSFTGSPGVTLSVTDLQVSRSQYSNWAELQCHSSCRLPDRSSYVWYKNGQMIQAETSSSYSGNFGSADSYSCAVKGLEDFPSPSVCVRGQTCKRVMYTDRSICAPKGSSVDISCTYNSYNNNYDKSTLWFSPERSHQWQNPSQPEALSEDSQYAGRVQVLETEGGRSTLRITDLRESDSAEYRFKFKTGRFEWSSSLPGTTLTVTVPALQVQVSRSSSSHSKELQCHSRCRLPDRPSYVWYKNGQMIQAETSSSYSVSFGSADSYSCAVNGHEDFPSPSVCVDGQTCNRVTYTDRSICASKGSSVDISCTYNSYNSYYFYSDKSTLWFSPERSHQWQNPSQPEALSEDSQYAGRVQVLETEGGRSTLRITDLRESDSAEYRFKFRTRSFEWRSSLPGTTLTVTDPDLQVLVRRSSSSSSSSWASLLCHSRCRLPDRPSYVWYKNGQMIQAATSSSYSGYLDSVDSYSCAVKGLEDFPSPSVCVRGQTCNRVTYTDRSICAPKGSSVDISCTYNSYNSYYYYYDKSTLWFSPERSHQWQNPSQTEALSEDSQYAGHVQVLETERGRSTLRITDLRESDSAEYRFKFKTGSFEWRSSLPGTTLTVTALQVQVTRITVHQSHTEAELKCHSSCSPTGRFSYVWFKNGEKITRVETSSYKGSFYPGDNISCAVKGHEDFPSPSVYAPKTSSVSASPSGEIVENSSVTLTCSSDANPAAKYTWYKENGNLKPLINEAELVFRSIQSSDSGEYYCTAENELGRRTSEHIFINVRYAPKTSSVSVSPSGKIMEGSSVTLTCSSDANPAAIYTWYKENQTPPQGLQGIYRFTSISSEDRGSYSCKSENPYGQINSSSLFIDVQYAPKTSSVSASPSGEIVENSSVTLTCSSDANPAAKYTWYQKNGNLKPLINEAELVFTSIQSSDSGEYYCTAENELGRRTSEHISINVRYAPKTSSVSVSPSGKIMEGSSVTLTCGSDANPAATYTWYKENQKVLQRPESIYRFTSISSEDRGSYYCKSENPYGQINSSSLSLDVQYAPKLPSVSVSPSAEILEGSSVTLTCSSDANPAAKYTWYKENQTLQGPEDIYPFTSISLEDSGMYHCQSENEYGQVNSTSVRIDVQYAPKLSSVSVSPSGQIVEGSSVNLTCSSDANPAANYTWYKENEDSPKASGKIFTITDIRPEHSGNYYCEAQNSRGRHNSTLHLIVVAGSMKSVAAGSITAIFLAVIFLCAFLLIRRKRYSKQTPEPEERPDSTAQLNMSSVYDHPSAAVQRKPAEEPGDLCYASVSFSKNQEDPLYSNIRPAQHNRHKHEEEEEEDGVEYTIVNFKSAGASPELRRQEAVEDASALYSTVAKNPRV
ncbi:hemicentin-2-like isoform X3 [Siniperca chuatsi]|uniref:hemicentin-2-like isoform X3 n=1 Tax=Siniperca chuatsi TaxID=119488 RepID=UPI001CE1BF4E|nr:hemicentin-2-like isoform X3 [Siniperca chuatsi]